MSEVTAPLPPDELIDRVTAGVTAANAEQMRQVFRETGRQSVNDLERALSAIGRTLDSYSRALDFGCGCGRILAWLEPLADRCELHGTDIDEAAIAWCRRHLPFADFVTAGHEPPLPYPDEHFDLVFNHSVLTHLDERHQDLWLAELRRVTRPGGTVILTVHGEAPFRENERAADANGPVWRERLESDGLLYIEEDAYVGSAFPAFYHTAFHAPWYVFEHWGRSFSIVAYIPRGSLGYQDVVVLARSEEEPPSPEPVRARPHGAAAPASSDPALARVHATLDRGVVPSHPSRFGAPGELARRLLLRVMRPFTVLEREVDRDLAEAVAQTQAEVEELRAAMAGSERMSPVVQDVLNRQAERINRLEAELRRLSGGRD
jgi:SAM-dependent methyltransferase